jgi:hypothetical protein
MVVSKQSTFKFLCLHCTLSPDAWPPTTALPAGPAIMDKLTEILIAALKQAMAQPGEQRLFRSGKLPGVFASRTSASADASAQSLREGLLEVVRTETKGKTTIEWVRATPKGVDFLHQHESPVRAMNELRAALQLTQEGIPGWVVEIRQHLQVLATRLTEEVQAVTHRLEALSQRVAEGLKRADGLVPALPDGTAAAVPWAQEALDYLERRRAGGVLNQCPLPELFTALREKQAELTVKDFHGGLRRLHDRGVLRLLPFEGGAELPEPEYALLDGAAVYYYVAR